MTAYFDDIAKELATFDISKEYPSQEEAERIRALEIRLVDDCTVTSMAPEFPEELRAAVARTILLGSIACQPQHLPIEYAADYEHFREHVGKLHKLSSDLHGIFHAVAHHPDCPFGDNPRSWFLTQLCAGEELRDEMAAELAGTTVTAMMEAAERRYAEGTRKNQQQEKDE